MVEKVLVEQPYARQRKTVRGPLRRSIENMAGLSGAQVTHLIARYKEVGARP